MSTHAGLLRTYALLFPKFVWTYLLSILMIVSVVSLHQGIGVGIFFLGAAAVFNLAAFSEINRNYKPFTALSYALFILSLLNAVSTTHSIIIQSYVAVFSAVIYLILLHRFLTMIPAASADFRLILPGGKSVSPIVTFWAAVYGISAPVLSLAILAHGKTSSGWVLPAYMQPPGISLIFVMSLSLFFARILFRPSQLRKLGRKRMPITVALLLFITLSALMESLSGQSWILYVASIIAFVSIFAGFLPIWAGVQDDAT